MALFLALTLLCVAIPAASAQAADNDGKTFYWDVSGYEVINGTLDTSSNYSDTFYVTPSDDVVANLTLSLTNIQYQAVIRVYDADNNLAYEIYDIDSVTLPMEYGKLYKFEVTFRTGSTPGQYGTYRISISKNSDL